jgi:hypothetical protein
MEMWWERIEMTCEHFIIRFLLILSLVGVSKKLAVGWATWKVKLNPPTHHSEL